MSREKRARPSPGLVQARQDPGGARRSVAPGKRTRAQGLRPRPGGTRSPMQQKPDSAADARGRARARRTAQWMDVAIRPDLNPLPVQREGAGAAQASAAQPAGGRGQPLPEAVQAKMEHAFGADFSAVRVHEGSRAPALGAQAFAQGSDIHFAPGSYDPASQRGQELLGHELAHVVQQAQGRVRPTVQARGVGINDDPALESEADVMGARAARGERAGAEAVTGAPGGASQAPIQGRFAARSYKEGLFRTEPGNAPANLQGIQNLLIRFYTRDLDDGGRTHLQDECARYRIDLNEALYQAPSAHTDHLYNLVVHEHPGAVYPGHTTPTVPHDGPERDNLALLVARAREVLEWMCEDGSARDFLEVFGDGAGGARMRTYKALTCLEQLAADARIGADRSGEHAEMMIGAHASFGSNILLQQGAFTSPPTDDLVATLIHETFHAANGDVLDGGGYPSNPEDFRQRSVPEKVHNASHYEEVARRYLGASPLGGDFRPATRTERDDSGELVTVDTRSPAERAMARVRSQVQIAWERCQNVHGLLKYQLGAPHPDYWPPILRWSRALYLQIHERERNHHVYGMNINYVDLLQVESMTKTLGQMMKAPLEPLLAHAPSSGGEEDIARSLLEQLATGFADGRWLTDVRLVEIVGTLHQAPRDVSTFS